MCREKQRGDQPYTCSDLSRLRAKYKTCRRGIICEDWICNEEEVRGLNLRSVLMTRACILRNRSPGTSGRNYFRRFHDMRDEHFVLLAYRGRAPYRHLQGA
eukprot:6200383-Pleurochrysis_carterae.AAC.2